MLWTNFSLPKAMKNNFFLTGGCVAKFWTLLGLWRNKNLSTLALYEEIKKLFFDTETSFDTSLNRHEPTEI